MKLEKYDPLAGKPTGEYVHDVLKKNIIRMHIEPGEKLSEQEVSNLLGVSRTPVRESFIKLGKEGAVYVLPQRGTYIAKINMEQVDEARFIRRNLEKAVFVESLEVLSKVDFAKMEENLAEQEKIINIDKSKLTAEDYADFLDKDDEFHKIPYIATGREMTWEFIDSINLNYQRVRTLSYALDFKLKKLYEEHSMILDAMRDKRADDLSELIEKHIRNLDAEKEKLADLFPNYFD